MARNWAIVIGINEYTYLEKLKYAKTDAEAMYQWLMKSGVFDPKKIFLFTDDSPQIPTNPPIPTLPTFGHLDAFFDAQFERPLLKSNDTLWFFFSGHGNRGGDGDYLMLFDSSPRRVKRTALSVSYITERLRNWGAGNVVMFIDACRNVEEQAKGDAINPRDYQGIITFYSCSAKEKSYEIESLKRGAFTHVLLQALEQTKEENKCLTVGELEAYLMREVPKLIKNQRPLAKVEPTYKTNFILFGEARAQDIETLKNLAIKKAFIENKKEEAKELLFHANQVAKGSDSEIINALIQLQSSSPVTPQPQPKPEPPEPLKENQNQEDKSEELRFQNFTENLGNGVTLEMVAIPGDKFMMGSPEGEGDEDETPQHEVTVPSFFIGKYPVTQAQYQQVIGSNPSHFKGDDRPVENVSWDDVVAFCQKLSQQTGKEYRLPTEAEWEYACRARTTTPYYFGETITDKQVNYYTTVGETTVVGQYPPNDFGLCDMHGNVLEWCEDYWHDDYKNAPIDGSPWLLEFGSIKVMRGGSWVSIPDGCRSATRFYSSRDIRLNRFGVRVVCIAPRTT